MSLYYRSLIEMSSLLLDLYPNAAVAYSLRKLRDGYKKVDNLLTYSEDISQATYSKTALVTTGTPPYIDVTLAPNGTMTADKLIEDVVFNTHFLSQFHSPTVVGLGYNFSVYLKAAERIKVDFQLSSTGTARINLSTGIIETNTMPVAPTVTNVGNGWWRVSGTFTATSTITNPLYRIFLVNGSNLTGYLGDGVSGVYVWGFQLTQSSSVLPYEKTVVSPDNGSAIRVRRSVDNAEQDIGFSGNNLDTTSMLDFVGYNLLTFSEEVNNAAYLKTTLNTTGIPPYIDVEIAPDGTLTGDKIIENISNGQHVLNRTTPVLLNGVTYNFSVFAKQAERTSIYVGTNLGGVNKICFINLTNGNISNNQLPNVPIVTSEANGWYRISFNLVGLGANTGVSVGLLNASNQTNYAGNNTSGAYVWGFQLSQTSSVKSYQKTVAIVAGNGFVTTWYDQSGNGRNAIQSTAANQAQIVNNGLLIIDSLTTKPTTQWSTDRYTLLANISTNTKYFLSVVWRRTSLVNLMPTLGNGVTPLYWLSSGFGNDIRSVMNSSFSHGASTTLLTNNTISLKNNANLAVVYQNSVALPNTSTIAPAVGTMNTWGLQSTNIFYSGEYQEIIYWGSEQSANRIGIETNINDYWNIY